MYDLILTKLKYVYNDDDNNIDLIKDFINNIKNSSNSTPDNPLDNPTDNPTDLLDDNRRKETDNPTYLLDDNRRKETDNPTDLLAETNNTQKETDNIHQETDDTYIQTSTPTNTPVNASDLLDDDEQKETDESQKHPNTTSDLMHDIIHTDSQKETDNIHQETDNIQKETDNIHQETDNIQNPSDTTSVLMHDIIHTDSQKETDNIQKETDDSKIYKLNCLFKKINILFKILADLLKYNISKIDNDRYKNVNDEKIKFPKTIDSLILIIGCYGDAFSYDDQEELFNILELPSYSDLYTISEIPISMIPFVANNKINLDALTNDYIIFSEKVLNFSCRILNINTDLEQDFIIENTIKTDD